MKTLTDSPELRARRLAAYNAGKYRFSPPPVYHGNWSPQAWMNHVHFDDESLTGFLPYVDTVIERNGVKTVLRES